MAKSLESALLEWLSANGPLPSAALLDQIQQECACSRASFYRELQRLEVAGALISVNKVIHLRPAFFAKERLDRAKIEESAEAHSDKLLSDLAVGRSLRWKANSLPRVHAIWSMIALALLKLRPGAPYIGWCPYPWFHISSTDIENQALAAHFADQHAFITITGFCGALAEEYLADLQSKGGTVRRVHEIPKNLRATHISLIEEYIISVKLSPALYQAIEKIFKSRASHNAISIAERDGLLAAGDSSTIILERSAQKSNKVRTILMNCSTPEPEARQDAASQRFKN